MQRLNIVVLAATLGSALMSAQQPTPTSSFSSLDYRLGAGDQIQVTVSDLDAEFKDKPIKVDLAGDVFLPYVGRVHAEGMTTISLTEQIKTRLAPILKNPDVVVSLTAFGSQPVSVLGAVNNPGIRQIEGKKTLFEVLSMAGGMRSDAGYMVRVIRDMKSGPIPVPSATIDPTQRWSILTVRLKSLLDGTAGDDNITVVSGDSISVPKADLVYAVGSVNKSGGFVLNEHENLSALQVLALAEGYQRTAAIDRAQILRMDQGGSNRVLIPINLSALLTGKAPDVPLRAGDILFVPNSKAKSISYRAIDAIVSAATGAAIYRW